MATSNAMFKEDMIYNRTPGGEQFAVIRVLMSKLAMTRVQAKMYMASLTRMNATTRMMNVSVIYLSISFVLQNILRIRKSIDSRIRPMSRV